jgi:hypothetical protein
MATKWMCGKQKPDKNKLKKNNIENKEHKSNGMILIGKTKRAFSLRFLSYY